MDPSKTLSLNDFAGKVVVINVGPVVRAVPCGDHPVGEGVRRHPRPSGGVPGNRRPGQRHRRSTGFRRRPQGQLSVDLRPGDAHHDRVRRQVPPPRSSRRRWCSTANTGSPRCSCVSCWPTTCYRWCSGWPPNPPRRNRLRHDRFRTDGGGGTRCCWPSACACWPAWCRSPRRAWCRWCRATCRIWRPSSVSTTWTPAPDRWRCAINGCGWPARRCFSSPASPRCSPRAPSPCWG